jgi:hypothetical protein
MMFYQARIDEGLIYFIRTLTEEQALVNFIEKNDNVENSIISKWKLHGQYLYKDVSLANLVTAGPDVNQNVYIANSLRMALTFSTTLIENSPEKEIQELRIVKAKKIKNKEFPSELFNLSDTNTFALLLIFAQESSVIFDYHNSAFYLQNGGIIFSENDKNYSVSFDSEDYAYFAYAILNNKK